jgi:hypothetical protein
MTIDLSIVNNASQTGRRVTVREKITSPKTIEESSGTANLKTQPNSAKCDYLIINCDPMDFLTC